MIGLTHNQFIKLFSDLAFAHKNINSFGTGDLWEYMANESDTILPVTLWVVIQAEALQGKTGKPKYTLVVMDAVDKGQENLDEVYSDTKRIAQDLVSLLRQPYYEGFFTLEQNVVFEPFSEKFDSEMAGHQFDLEFNQPFLYDACEVNIDGLPAVNMDSIYINTSTYYFANILGDALDNTNLAAYLNSKVPTSRTLTINGTTYDLSQNRSWNISTGAVSSVFGRTGAVVAQAGDYTKSDVGLSNVDNISDVNKPVSTAQAAADLVAENNAKAYADSLVVGLWDDRGSFDASVNAYPSSGGSGTAGAILKGDTWTVSVAGTLPTGQVVEVGDIVRALINTPGNTQANWAIQQNNIGYTAENSANKTSTVSGNTTSTSLYLTVKGYYDYLIALTWLTDLIWGTWISGLTAKTTPVDADFATLMDSADSNKAKKVSWANIKATLKSYFDTLYPSGSGTSTGTNTGDQTSVSGNAGTATALQTARTIDGQSFNGTANITVIAPGTNAATSKATPVDADEMPLVDSAASNVLKKLTWANLKATLKTYFDTLYIPISYLATPTASTAGIVPLTYFIRQRSVRNLANQGTIQQLFDSVTNGTFTLPIGAYEFETMFFITSMSGTSGNSSFSIAGTGVTTNFYMASYGVDTAPVTGNYNITGSAANSSAFGTNTQTAGTGTAQASLIKGSFEITTAGTIIPSVTLTTAAAAVVGVGSYFKITCLGTNTVLSAGPVS